MSTTGSNQKLLAIAIVAIIALLGLSAYLLYQNNSQRKMVDKQTEELMESERINTELEKQYYQSLSELEEMKGTNTEMNNLIDSQKDELKKQKERISRLLTDSKNLQRARSEIQQMKTLADQYVDEINRLKKENQQLAQTNVQLKEEKKILTTEVEKERRSNDELVTSKTVLESELGKLEKEKLILSKKVDIASAIKVSNVEALGYKIRSNGKDAQRDRAKVIDKLKVCFTAISNNVVQAGEEEFHVRLIDPVGETMAVEALGSGVILNNISNEEVRYTQSTQVMYENDNTNACVIWQPETTFKEGNYEVEVYNKGYLAGTGNFVLK